MKIFKKLRYQNFLATGNLFNEVDLSASKSTLIVGTNGVGKSTMIEALSYVLYGRAFRNITLPQLINSITNKKLLVELEFSIGSNEYFIRRGMKPDVFEVHINGNIQPSQGKVEDQRQLEERILKMNFKSFCQIVVLGSTNYIPFMQLKALDRRKVVENLLDIEVFTTMNTLLKKYADDNSAEISNIDRQVEIIEGKVEVEKKHAKSLQEDTESLIQNANTKIAEYEQQIVEFNNAVVKVLSNISNKEQEISDLDKVNRTKTKLIQLEASLEEKLKKLRQEIGFFKDHDDCPTCKQTIDTDFKTSILQEKECKHTEVDEAVKLLEAEIEKNSARLKEINAINREITELNSTASEHNQNIKFANVYIRDLNSTIQNLRSKSDNINTDTGDIASLNRSITELNQQKSLLVNKKAMYTIAGKLLKDSGIKSKVISQYIPVMNKLINNYLSKMELFVDFQLDENFNETIKSRHRDMFSFESFSEGEKMRISLAILFTWRAIAKMRNSAATNLLIMDEVADSSTDLTGIDNMIDIIEETFADQNVFVISHSEKMAGKLDTTIRVDKVGNFTVFNYE